MLKPVIDKVKAEERRKGLEGIGGRGGGGGAEQGTGRLVRLVRLKWIHSEASEARNQGWSHFCLDPLGVSSS